MSDPGHVVGGPADPDYDGAVLTAPLAVGDTLVYVNDTADFDEQAAERGACLLLGVDLGAEGAPDPSTGAVVPYKTAYDEYGVAVYGFPETEHTGTPNTLELIAPSTVTGSVGDRIYIQNPVSLGAVGQVEVLVALDGGDQTGDSLPAYIDTALLESVGEVDLTDLAVDIDEDEDGQLYVSGFPGLTQRQGRYRWKQDYATATGNTAVTVHLTYRPVPDTAVKVSWGGVGLDRDEWDFSDPWTIVVPAQGFHAGDVFEAHYAWTDPTPRPVIPGSAIFVGATVLGDNNATEVALPAGTQPGDLLGLVMMTGGIDGTTPTCSDPRIGVQYAAAPHQFIGYGFVTSSTDPIAINISDGEHNGDVMLVGYRVTGNVTDVTSNGTTTFDPALPAGSEAAIILTVRGGTGGTGGGTVSSPQGDWTRDVDANHSSQTAESWSTGAPALLSFAPYGQTTWWALTIGLLEG